MGVICQTPASRACLCRLTPSLFSTVRPVLRHHPWVVVYSRMAEGLWCSVILVLGQFVLLFHLPDFLISFGLKVRRFHKCNVFVHLNPRRGLIVLFQHTFSCFSLTARSYASNMPHHRRNIGARDRLRIAAEAVNCCHGRDEPPFPFRSGVLEPGWPDNIARTNEADVLSNKPLSTARPENGCSRCRGPFRG